MAWYINHEHLPSLWITTNKATELLARHAQKDQKILDLGCGKGELLDTLKAAGYTNLAGCDIITSQSKSLSGVPLKSANFNFDKLPYQDGEFDVVFSFETIEHMENPRQFLREAWRVTKPGGIVIVSTPNIFHIFNRLSFLKNGEMYRFNKHNDHWSMFPKGVFEKTFFPYFLLLETIYLRGEFPYRLFSKFNFPENKWFGRSVCWIFQRKESAEI